MKSRDYYYASRLTSEQAGQCTSWEFPSIAKRLGLENKNVLPADFDRDRQELERHIEMSKKLGFDEGFAKGKDEGYKTGFEPLVEKAKIFSSLLLAFEVGVKGLDHLFENLIIQLSIEIAKAIIRHELKTSPQQVEKVVKEALSYLPKNSSGIKLHMHVDDIALIKETVDAEILDNLKNVDFIADQALVRGGCILEADESYINATIGARLDTIFAEINSELYGTTSN